MNEKRSPLLDVASLLAIAAGSDVDQKRAALTLLAGQTLEDADIGRIVPYLHDPDRGTANATLTTLMKIGGRAIRPVLDAVKYTADPAAKLRLVLALEKIGQGEFDVTPSEAECVPPLLGNDSPDVRLAACRVLRTRAFCSQFTKAGDILIWWLTDRTEPQNRSYQADGQWAREAIATLAVIPGGARCLRQAILYPDEIIAGAKLPGDQPDVLVVAARAAEALGKRKDGSNNATCLITALGRQDARERPAGCPARKWFYRRVASAINEVGLWNNSNIVSSVVAMIPFLALEDVRLLVDAWTKMSGVCALEYVLSNLSSPERKVRVVMAWLFTTLVRQARLTIQQAADKAESSEDEQVQTAQKIVDLAPSGADSLLELFQTAATPHVKALAVYALGSLVNLRNRDRVLGSLHPFLAHHGVDRFHPINEAVDRVWLSICMVQPPPVALPSTSVFTAAFHELS